ncbi:MAG: phosphate/phosphite/phosphonate ABC transporter substrate-binding protein [Alphaproteobacteria bacterium]|nr:phosphate/phosphite/phosphonate ABC transporter substrate-binding protein [Alphaproteobacteria bacterium]
MRFVNKLGLAASCLIASLLAAFQANAQTAPLDVGIFPHLSVRTLMERFQPLRDHLERSLQRPVTFVTAPDFQTFVERTQAKQYSFVITAPHFARLAQLKAGYRPLLQPKSSMRGVFLVSAAAPIFKLADLKGRKIATPDRLAVVTAMGEDALQAEGVKIPTDAALLALPSHNAAVLALKHGQADAALISELQFLQMKAEERAELRPIATTKTLPMPLIFMAGPDMPGAEAQAIGNAILDFAKTEEGKRFLETTRYQDIEPTSEAEMKQLDPYLPALERALSEKP